MSVTHRSLFLFEQRVCRSRALRVHYASFKPRPVLYIYMVYLRPETKPDNKNDSYLL